MSQYHLKNETFYYLRVSSGSDGNRANNESSRFVFRFPLKIKKQHKYTITKPLAVPIVLCSSRSTQQSVFGRHAYVSKITYILQLKH